MFGITPMPIFDPEQKAGYMKDSMVFCREGDIIKFLPVSREQYDDDLLAVEQGRFSPRVCDVRFDLHEFENDMVGYNAAMCRALDDD